MASMGKLLLQEGLSFLDLFDAHPGYSPGRDHPCNALGQALGSGGGTARPWSLAVLILAVTVTRSPPPGLRLLLLKKVENCAIPDQDEALGAFA